jgi:hypothetical protein
MRANRNAPGANAVVTNVFERHPDRTRSYPSSRPLPRCLLVTAFGAMSIAHAGSAPTISASLIAGGGGFSQSPGACLKLDSSIGQAIAGTSSGSNLELRSGYWPGQAGSPRDSVFNNSFEECL